ncbi:hypothetical protein EDB92DRAFT_1861266 [Lactarius akahatsu]|uniref:Uncharacterized protein n=1 Tax=Lactarius akahatsu TaxID=416441 RepID=A0AAD4LG74_9AGAM|nr:hypothetical protein EDB92DRAFT_1861266 [Lactarius akahatsu]
MWHLNFPFTQSLYASSPSTSQLAKPLYIRTPPGFFDARGCAARFILCLVVIDPLIWVCFVGHSLTFTLHTLRQPFGAWQIVGCCGFLESACPPYLGASGGSGLFGIQVLREFCFFFGGGSGLLVWIFQWPGCT